jgi:hypothetical protein
MYTNKYLIPFLIDDADYQEVSRHSWCFQKFTNRGDGYVCTRLDGHIVRLHQFLLGRAPEGLEWDHENQMKWDNRRENLRAVTPEVNHRNVRLLVTNTSGVKGVSWKQAKQRWEASIKVDDRNLYIGSYNTLEEAAEARKDAEEVFWDTNKSQGA